MTLLGNLQQNQLSGPKSGPNLPYDGFCHVLLTGIVPLEGCEMIILSITFSSLWDLQSSKAVLRAVPICSAK